jgi:hypothetical protein
MAELADALDSGSSGRKAVGVQISLRAKKAFLGKGRLFCLLEPSYLRTFI